MQPHPRYSDYDNFAWTYNRHWGAQFLAPALAALEKLVLPQVSKNARVLDLCCGTGQLDQELSNRGYKLTGIVGSEKMLRFARQRAPGVTFILDDARTFSLPDKYDVTVSMFDSLNHILKSEELTTTFRNVFVALEGGGLFLFDMNMEQGYKDHWNGTYGIVEDDHVCIIQNSYDPETFIAQFEATVFRLEHDWYRFDVTLLQRCYSDTEVRFALQSAGFVNIVGYSYHQQSCFRGLNATSQRAFYLCHKP
jgi:SAM-dependent methyltransferase